VEAEVSGALGHRGPQEPDELPCDREIRNGRAFAVLGEVPVAVIEPDVRLPGALVRLGAGRWPSGCVSVVPGRFDQQPAGVAVAGVGDGPAVLLIAG
jgi:hypothetical protein